MENGFGSRSAVRLTLRAYNGRGGKADCAPPANAFSARVCRFRRVRPGRSSPGVRKNAASISSPTEQITSASLDACGYISPRERRRPGICLSLVLSYGRNRSPQAHSITHDRGHTFCRLDPGLDSTAANGLPVKATLTGDAVRSNPGARGPGSFHARSCSTCSRHRLATPNWHARADQSGWYTFNCPPTPGTFSTFQLPGAGTLRLPAEGRKGA
jgi:hypothetical protein